jgi:plastocyanin domain-containing protein
MQAVDVAVILAGIAAVLWVNWYFFFAERAAVAASAGAGSLQEVVVTVHGGYEPATVRVKAGRPARLVFDRQETSSCSEEVVFPDFGIRTFLPAHRQTPVELTPTAPGTYEFTCGMGMLRGKLVAE